MFRIAIIFACLFCFFLPTQAHAAQTPGPCVPVESQSWWKKDAFVAPGDMQHVHAGACFPYKQVVSGDYVLDVTVKMHNEPGRYLIQARIDDDTDQDPQVRFSTPVSVQCPNTDCAFTVPITVPTDQLPTGTHEWRVGALSSPANRFSSSVTELNLATNGWQVCIRSCAGRTPANDRFEGRGWYETQTPTGVQVVGYNNVTWGWQSAHDAEFPWNPQTAAYRPVSGTWTPPIWIHNGAVDGDVEPVDLSRCWVDPDFHAGSSGTQVLNTAGPFQGRLSIDTTRLANGLHKLVCAAGSSEDGFLDGVQVFPFQVQNAVVPPDTVIDDLILGEGFQVYATFHGVWQTANGGSFQCAVFFWTSWEPCSSPKTYQGLPSGSSTAFGVRAIEQGRIDPTPAWWPFTVP